MKTRLQVILAKGGIASRRKSKEIIESGRVRVNGIVIREKGFKADPFLDRVEIDGNPIGFDKKVYLILNKPKGVITTASDEKGRTTVLDLVHKKLRIYPVGRLDKDTEGVIILTNDGDLAYRLTHPRFGVKKKYIVEVRGTIKTGMIKRLEKGIYLDGKRTAPCKISIIKKHSDKIILKFEIHEGRKRQIRRMIEKIGGRVLGLRRIEYAGITTKGLNAGESRYLSQAEVTRLKNN